MINEEQSLVGKITGGDKLVGKISTSSASMSGKLNNPVIKTGNYNNLTNKPKINDIELIGNVSLEALDIQGSMDNLSNTDIERLIGD